MLTVSHFSSVKQDKHKMIDRSSKLLRELRESHGLTYITLAVAIGASRSNVQYWEAGRSLPSLPHAVRLARFYETTVEDLYGYLAEDGKT